MTRGTSKPILCSFYTVSTRSLNFSAKQGWLKLEFNIGRREYIASGELYICSILFYVHKERNKPSLYVCKGVQVLEVPHIKRSSTRFIRGLLLKPKHTPKPHAKYRGLYLGVWAYNLIAGPLAQSSSFCIFGNRMTKSPAEFNPWSQKNR
jgi:hypothetical protein